MDRVPRRSKSYLQQLRLSVYTRQASIAIGLEDYAAARSQLAYLRDEVRTLPAGNALFGHFSKAVLDLEHMMACLLYTSARQTAYTAPSSAQAARWASAARRQPGPCRGIAPARSMRRVRISASML